MIMAIEKIALDNVKKSIENEEIPATTVIDPITAVAYEESVAAAEHVSEVESELEEKAEAVILDAPEVPEVKADTIYTKKITLDESLEEFDFASIDGSKDDADRYIEFDMFDFIFSLFASETDPLTRPLKALTNLKKGRGRKKADDNTPSSFMYQGSDDYIDETGEKGVEGVAQISTDTEGNVVLYQDTIEAFDMVKEICDEYGFTYEGPTPKKAPWVRWNFSFVVHVPTYSDGYPMEVEDYFEKRGIPMEEVMPPEFIRGRTKDYKKLNDEVVVENIFDKFVVMASRNGDMPLEGFIKDMFKELDQAGVKYDRKVIKDRFLAEFEDDFEDDMEEGFISGAIDSLGDTVGSVVQNIL